MFSKKKFAIASNLRFISRAYLMLSRVEHEKSFIALGPRAMDGVCISIKNLLLVNAGLL